MAASGGRTAATALIPTAAGIDQNRTTFQARTISAMQVPISQKYVAFGESPLMVSLRADGGRMSAGELRTLGRSVVVAGR
jgi:hypothetical protein